MVPENQLNLWDEIQETILTIGGLLLWGGFEVLCFKNPEFAAAPHTQATRIALITICTNMFTYRFTKSLPRGAKHE